MIVNICFYQLLEKKLTRNELSQLMIRFSKLYLNDKAQLSTTMIAKITMSHHLGELKKKQEEMSKQRGTSINTINNIYIKRTIIGGYKDYTILVFFIYI